MLLLQALLKQEVLNLYAVEDLLLRGCLDMANR
jgi:hypothetical protein